MPGGGFSGFGSVFLGSPADDSSTDANAGLATGSGAAQTPQIKVSPQVGVATGTGSAHNATVTTGVSAQAQLASGSGAAQTPQVAVAPQAGLASGSGAAHNATVSTGVNVQAGLASGSGAAQAPQVAIAPHADLASGTGTAHDATVTAESAGTDVFAGVATGTGIAQTPQVSIAPTAGAAGGSGAALGPQVAIQVNPTVATGSGAAHDAATSLTTSASDTGAGTDDATLDAARTGAEVGDAVDDAWTDTPGPTEAGVGSDIAYVTKFVEMPTAACGPYSGPVSIKYDGIDFTSCVLFKDTRFKSVVNGAVGTCVIRIKDAGRGFSFITGRPLSLEIEGQVEWGGFVSRVRRGYFTTRVDQDEPEQTIKYFELEGVDYNFLLQKRVLYDKIAPTTTELTQFPPETDDDVIIKFYASTHLDLEGDGLDTETLVEHVGTPSLDKEISGAAGWPWGQLLGHLRRNTGAIDYIDPERRLVHTDVDTPNAPFGISDNPGPGQIGAREIEIDELGTKLRNDAMVWGAGQGQDTVAFSRVTDDDSVDEHQLWQVGLFSPSVWRPETVERMADSQVYGSPQNKRGGKDPAFAVRCVIFEPGLRVAHKVEFESQVHGYADTLPVRSIEIDFPEKNPRYAVVMSHEIDDPWSTTEFWFPDFGVDVGGVGIPELDIPEIVFELPAVVRGDSFNRTVGSGWGIPSNLDGVTWTQVNSPPSTVSVFVNGSHGVIHKSNDPDGGASVEMETPTTFFNDQRLLVEFEFRLQHDTTFMRVFVYGPDVSMQFDVSEVSNQLRMTATVTDASSELVSVETFPDVSSWVNQPIVAKILIEPDTVSAKLWNAAAAEPAYTTATNPAMDFDPTGLDTTRIEFHSGTQITELHQFFIDYIAFDQGGGIGPGEGDPGGIPDPPGYPAGFQYFQFAPWNSLTEEVWLDRRFLRRGIDYVPYPAAGWIAIPDAIDTNGKEVFMRAVLSGNPVL